MKRVLLTTIFAVFAFAAFGRVSSIRPIVEIRMTPTSGSWDYKVNEPISFEVSVEKNQLAIPEIGLYYAAGPDMMREVLRSRVDIVNGKATIDVGSMDKPGFYTVNASVVVDGETFQQWKTVGVEREKLEPTVMMPNDFKEFWNRQLAAVSKVPLKSKIERMDERCTSKVDVYHISYNINRDKDRFYGVLCIPKGEGTFPAVLKVPGAGARPYAGDVKLAEKGYITLEVGIHGIPVDNSVYHYNALLAKELKEYYTFGIEDKESYYYKNVYVGCVRGVDFIFDLPQFDGKNIAVMGGSQGGALTVIVSALDSRVVCGAANYPALSDMTGYLHNRAGGWPHLLKDPTKSKYNTKEIIETLSYYDAANFARILNVPMFYTAGYNDKVCPPTSTFSLFNATPSPKEVYVVYETAHWIYPQQWTKAVEFIDKYLK